MLPKAEQGASAYSKTQKTVANPRQAEYIAFSEATRQLIEASDGRDEDLQALIKAIHLNKSLWGTLAQDCANEENLLPRETRAAIISLAEWVTRYSRDVMRNRDSIDPLVDVNKLIMDGIAGNTETK